MLDRYILAKSRRLVEEMTVAMDAYDLFGACARIRAFVDVLTNWYIRRSRQRFWDGDHDAIDTLHTVLDVVVRVAAPLLPFVADEIHGGLHRGRSDGRTAGSVHLRDWPRPDELPADDELVTTMDHVRDVCSATLSVRKAHGRRVRQPLASLTVAVPDADKLAPFVEIIADEVNVRDIALTDDVGAVAGQVLQVLPASIGPRLGRHTQDVIRAVKAGDWRLEGDRVEAGGHWLEPGEFTLTMVADGERPSQTLERRHRRDRARRRPDPRAGAGGQGARRRPPRPAGSPGRRSRRHRPHRAAITADATWIDAVLAHEDLIAGETLAVEITTDASGSDTPEIAVRRR